VIVVLHLDNLYTTPNSTSLANDLIKLKINNNHRLLTLYVNIPTKETIDTTETQLLKYNDKETTNQITKLLDIILSQNYFIFQDQIFQPEKGGSHGLPISRTIAEVFLQKLVHTHVKHLLDTYDIIFYTRYVDDILIIYDATRTNPNNVIQYTGTIHSNIRLEPTSKTTSCISFLYLMITRMPNNLEIGIFRKPTTTNTTINYLSDHPLEHKMAAYRFLIERMLTLPPGGKQQQKEWETIQQTAHSNDFPENFLKKLKQRITRKLTQPTPPPHKKEWHKMGTFHLHIIRC
jgi:hypothetical protein